MPDDTINYKVNVDVSSLAEQLNQIKSQVDQAMATYTFNATLPDPTPRAYAFPTQAFSSQLTDAGQVLGNAATMAQQQALNFVDTARLGFQKFSHDVQNSMLMTPLRTPGFADPSQKFMPDMSNMGISRLGWEMLTGWGYNPRMSVTPGRYSELMQDRLSDKAFDAVQGIIDFGAGATSLGGLAAGALGATGAATALGIAAVPLGIASIGAGAFTSTFGYDISGAMRGRAFARDASWRFLSGRFSNQDASNIGLTIATAGRSAATVGFDVTQNDAMGMVQQFTEMGGMDNVRTAEEFRDRVRTVVNNTRKIMEVMNVTQTEAVGFMKEWINMGLVNSSIPSTATSMGIGSAAMAYRAGYSGAEFHQFGMQSAEMVRGTGISMGAGYMSGQTSLAGITSMMSNGALGIETVAQLGGAESAAATMNRIGFNFGMSDAGLTYFAARDALGAGGVGALNPMSALGAAVGRIKTPADYLAFRGAQSRMAGQVGGEALFGGQAAWYLAQFKQLQGAYPDMVADEDTFTAFVRDQSRGQVSEPEARLMWAKIAAANTGEASRRMGRTISEAERQTAMARPGILAQTGDIVFNAAAAALGTQSVAASITDLGNAISRGAHSIERFGQSGELMGGIAMAIAPGTDGFFRALGTQRTELNELYMDTGLLRGAAQSLTGTRAVQSELDRVANLSQDIRNVGFERLFASESVLTKYGYNTLTEGSAQQRLTTASEQYTVLEAKAKTGDKTAQALTAQINRAEYIAAVGGMGHAESRGQVEATLRTLRASGAGINVRGFKEIAKDADTVGESIAHRQSIGKALGTGGAVRDLVFKMIGDIAPDESRYVALASEYQHLGEDRFKAMIAGRASERGNQGPAAVDIANQAAEMAKMFVEDERGRSLLLESALTRISKTPDAQVAFKTIMGEALGTEYARLDYSQAGNIQDAVRELSSNQTKWQKYMPAVADLAGGITETGSNRRNKLSNAQMNNLVNLKAVEDDMERLLKEMNVDFTTMTPAHLQKVGTELIVAELKRLNSAFGGTNAATALSVRIIP